MLDYLPGFVQGIARVLISYPFDYFRILKQSDKSFNYTKEIKNLTFLRGLFFPLFSVPIDRAITFQLYETLKKENKSSLECSAYPSILSSIYMTPISLVNTHYIYFKETPLKTIINNSIRQNIFRGFTVEVTRNTLSSMIYLYTYKKMSEVSNSPFLNGSMSSLSLWTLLYPLDTIKVKKFITNQSYPTIIKESNLRSLYNGIGLVYLKTIPSAGIGMVLYEYTKKRIEELK